MLTTCTKALSACGSSLSAVPGSMVSVQLHEPGVGVGVAVGVAVGVGLGVAVGVAVGVGVGVETLDVHTPAASLPPTVYDVPVNGFCGKPQYPPCAVWSLSRVVPVPFL